MPNAAFIGIFVRFSYRWASFYPTVRQLSCEPHVAASDSLEKHEMTVEHAKTKPNLAMRPRDAAKALGVSERLLWQWTHDGVIPSVKVGRTVLYPTAELQAWLSRQADMAKGGDTQ